MVRENLSSNHHIGPGVGREGPWRASYLLAVAALLAMSMVIYPALAFTDSDGDGMDDTWEADNGLDPGDPSDGAQDPDRDGLNNTEEYLNWTDPFDDDTDSDRIPDGWEVRYGLDPLNGSDASGDPDGDGHSNLQEYWWDTDPNDGASPVEPPEEEADGMADRSAVVMVFFFFMIGGIVVLLVIFGIYSKIRREKVLDHETRKRIVDFIRGNPGTHYTAMIEALDLAHGVLTHHINILESQEIVFSKQDRQYRRFYVDGMYRTGPLILGTQKRVLDEIRRHPGWSQSRIARKLGLSRMIVSYHVAELERLDMVSVNREGRETQLFPSAPAGDSAEGFAVPGPGTPLGVEGS